MSDRAAAAAAWVRSRPALAHLADWPAVSSALVLRHLHPDWTADQLEAGILERNPPATKTRSKSVEHAAG